MGESRITPTVPCLITLSSDDAQCLIDCEGFLYLSSIVTLTYNNSVLHDFAELQIRQRPQTSAGDSVSDSQEDRYTLSHLPFILRVP